MSIRPSAFRGPAVALVAGLLGVGGCSPTGDDDEPTASPSCTSTTYRVSHVELASAWGDVVRLGVDIDGDGDLDNKLGGLNATLTQVYGDWRPQEAMDAMLGGAVAWLARVERCDDGPALAVQVAVGVDSDGDRAFEVTDWGEPAIGEGREARGGVGFLPVGRLGAGAGEAADGWSPELGLAIVLRPGTRELTAIFGFGVAVSDELLAPVAGFLSAALARDDSRFADGLDLDRDGAVSVGELRQAPAVRALLASDLDLTVPCGGGECYQPGGDGVADRISLGLGVTLAPVAAE
jgi:hypothetical protein